MARIRSVHPGLFTDAAFIGLSDAAKVFLIGIWTECDDQGVFEWKLIELRIKLRPGSDGSVEPLLAELEAGNFVRSYELNGRKLGAVRNFRRFQRPKKPNCVYLLPSEFRTYVGLSDEGSEPDAPSNERSSELEPLKRASVPQKGEKSFQMEDGGCREGEGEGISNTEKTERATGADAPRYSFAGKVIKLNRSDHAKWAKTFASLNLDAELESYDAYLTGELVKHRRGEKSDFRDPKDWFLRTLNYLKAKDQQERRFAKPEGSDEPAPQNYSDPRCFDVFGDSLQAKFLKVGIVKINPKTHGLEWTERGNKLGRPTSFPSALAAELEQR